MKDALGFDIVEAPKPAAKDLLGFEIVQPKASEPPPEEGLDVGIGPSFETNMEDLAAMTPEQKTEHLKTSVGRLGTALGIAASFAAPQATVPAAAGWIARAGITAANLGAQGAVQSAAEEGTKQILGASEPSAAKLGTESLKGATAGGILGIGGSIAAPVAKWALNKTVMPAARAVGEFLEPGLNRARRAAATLFQRPVPSEGQMAMRGAREAIEEATGVSVPVSVAEAIGRPEEAGVLGSKDAEVTPQALESLKRSVVLAATQLSGSGATAENIASHAISLLDNELGQVSKPAREAVESLSKEWHPAIANAEAEAESAARGVIPNSAATPTSAGNRIRSIAGKSFQELSNKEAEAWNAAREHPDYQTVSVPLEATAQWADNQANNTLKSRGGTPLGQAMPKGINPLIDTVAEAEGASGLEQVRQFRTRVGESIGNDNVFPGASDAAKKQLYKALSQDIENAVGALPDTELKDLLENASGLTKVKYARFEGRPVESILNEFGAKGGAGPAAIASRLSGKEGPQVLETLETAVGDEHVPELHNAIREYLFNDAAQAGRDTVTGAVSAKGILNKIEGLAPEIQKKFFPNLDEVRRLALRESRIAEARGAGPAMMRALRIDDPTLLYDALGSQKGMAVNMKLQEAFKASRALEDELHGSVIGALRTSDGERLTEAVSKNPVGFIDKITTGDFSALQTKKAMDILARESPALVRDLQFRYVDQMLQAYSRAGKSQLGLAARDIAAGSARLPEGELRELSRAILGNGKTDALESVLSNIGQIERTIGSGIQKNPTGDLAAQTIGGFLGSLAGRSIGAGPSSGATKAAYLFKRYPEYAYHFGAWLLTTPELKAIAMKPAQRITDAEWNTLLRGFTAYMVGNHTAEDSPEGVALRRLAQ